MWIVRRVRERLEPQQQFDSSDQQQRQQRRCSSSTGCLMRLNASHKSRQAPVEPNCPCRTVASATDDDCTASVNSTRHSCCPRSCFARPSTQDHHGAGVLTKLMQAVCNGSTSSSTCRVPRCKWWKSLCSRIYLISVNLGSFIGGWSLIAFGIWIHVQRDTFVFWPLFRDNPTDPVFVIDQLPVIFTVVGLVFAVMSFLGCCGACTDSVCFLGFYTLFLICVIVAEVTVGVLTTALKQQISNSLLDSMHYQVQREYNKTARNINMTSPDVLKVTIAWDTLQARLNCCAVQGPQDYVHSSWFNHTRDLDGIFVPPSCCSLVPGRNVINENLCQVAAILYPSSINDSVHLYTKGCYKAVLNWVDEYSQQVVGLPLSLLILLQAVALVLTCVLLRWVRQKQSDYWWYVTEDCE